MSASSGPGSPSPCDLYLTMRRTDDARVALERLTRRHRGHLAGRVGIGDPADELLEPAAVLRTAAQRAEVERALEVVLDGGTQVEQAPAGPVLAAQRLALTLPVAAVQRDGEGAPEVVVQVALIRPIGLGAPPEGVVSDPRPHRLDPLARGEVRRDRRLEPQRAARPVLVHVVGQVPVAVAVPVAVLPGMTLGVRGVDRDRVAPVGRYVEPRRIGAQALTGPVGALAAEHAPGLHPVGVGVEVLDLVQAHAEHRQELGRVVLGPAPHARWSRQPGAAGPTRASRRPC